MPQLAATLTRLLLALLCPALVTSCRATSESTRAQPARVDAVGGSNEGDGRGDAPPPYPADVAVGSEVRKETAVDVAGGEHIAAADATNASNGLVLHWAFNENAGIVAKDSSVNNLTGTLAGRDGAVPKWASGKSGSALQFNRTVDNDTFKVEYVELSSGATNGHLDVGPDEDLTVSVWLKREGDLLPGGDGMSVYQKKGPGRLPRASPGYGLHTDAASRLLGFFGDGVHSLTVVMTQPLERGSTWHHVVLVFDHHSLANCGIYFDGAAAPVTRFEEYVENNEAKRKEASLLTGSLASTMPLVVGYSSNGSDSFFNGTIDELRIFKRALTAQEAQALYMSP